MSLVDWLIVIALVVFVLMLLHANSVLGDNPYQQIKAHEDLTGPSFERMSVAQKARQINLFGISPTNRSRPPLLAFAVAALFLILLWLHQ